MKQFLAIILSISLMFPAVLFAQETDNNEVETPKVIEINLGEPAPFTGVLLLNSVKVSLEATENKYTSIMNIKDTEIERLSNIALAGANDHSEWWAAGGFLVGTLVALGIFFAAAEAGK